MRDSRVCLHVPRLLVLCLFAGCDERNPAYLGVQDAPPPEIDAGGDATHTGGAGGDSNVDAAGAGAGGTHVGMDDGGIEPPACSPAICRERLGQPACGDWSCEQNRCVASDRPLSPIICGTGVCAREQRVCSNGQLPACTPGVPAAAIDGCGGGDEDCDGSTDEDCDDCVRVVAGADDDDDDADGSKARPFASVQAAIEHAASHPGGPQRVCVAAGPTCADRALFDMNGDNGLSMRDGVSVLGSFASANWQRCVLVGDGRVTPTTTLRMRHPDGVLFAGTFSKPIALDGFRILRQGGPGSTTAVTVKGARDVSLVHLLVDDDPSADSTIGVVVQDGGAVTLRRSAVSGGRGKLEATGVRVIGARVDLRDNCADQDERGRCRVDACTGGHLGVRGLVDATERESRSHAVWLSNAAGSSVEGSGLCNHTTSSGATIRVDGDARGVRLRGNVITAGGTGKEVHAVRFESCGDANPWLVDNHLIAAEARGPEVSVAAVHAAGACHPIIQGNRRIVAGAEGPALGAAAIDCAAASRCHIFDNLDIAGGDARSLPVVAVGVSCRQGGCARVAGNRIAGGFGKSALGLRLDATSTIVARNLIEGGCGALVVGVRSERTAARLENNRIFAARCPEGGGNQNAIGVQMVLTGADEDELDVHSNFIDGAGRSVGCVSAAVSIEAGTTAPAEPAGLFRNNILRAGDCMTRIAVRETTATADPRVFSHNALIPLDRQVLYLDEGKSALTLAAVDDLDDLESEGNISVDPRFLSYPTDLRLGAGSACIDAGGEDGAPDADAEGRPRDDKPDIGPYERSARELDQ